MDTPAHQSGNKAINLAKLKNAGFRVPEFVVLKTGLEKPDFYRQCKSVTRKHQFFAVRSSSVTEDTGKSSNAGLFYSALAINSNQLFDEYQKVSQSLGITAGSVIIQQFIPTHVSGVMFTQNTAKQCVINSTMGLCTSVVEGRTCDEYIMNQSGVLISEAIADKKELAIFDHNKIVNASGSSSSLNNPKLKQLYKTGKNIEAFYNKPQDIEWGFYKNKLYILQSRPITRSLPTYNEKVHYDSANIAESYSGIVLPLTLTFAAQVYTTVYRNLIHYSGVSWKKINKHNYIFDNMLAWFYGRMYYNMNNWYKMSMFIPGYKRNKENLELMITSNINDEIIRQVSPSLFLKIAYPFIALAKILVQPITQFLFTNRVKHFMQRFRKIDLQHYTVQQCQKLFTEMNKRLIEKWHIPVENDFMVMTWYGLLKKRFKEQELNQIIYFESKSTQQINELIGIKRYINANAKLKQLFEQQDFMALKGDKGLQAIINNYFVNYGGRFANELKLESEDIEDNIEAFFEMLKLYDIGNQAEQISNGHTVKLSVADKYILKKFKASAAKREELRLLRSNCFSMARKLFNHIGEINAVQGIINNKEDIYYLQLNEVFEMGRNFKGTVQSRKDLYETYQDKTPRPFFSIANNEPPPCENQSAASNKLLKGRACSTGIIQGKVKVLKQYEMPKHIDFEILVTSHTDPGWATLLGLVKGLVVEHGGILSHAAIIARELGIPTVVGVNNATSLLKSGQVVKIDGNKGTIEVMEDAQ